MEEAVWQLYFGKRENKRRMKIHKRVKWKRIFGERTKCGMWESYTFQENIVYDWKKVTCKNCLRGRW